MAEIVYKSPGVFTREVDNSQPSQTSAALSTPAGVIGTANLGPAFVPITVQSVNELTAMFGDVDGTSFGRMAAAEYLRQGGGSIAYVRVLGIGDGKARNTNGSVTNAGYVVGNQIIQSNGNVGKNIYANNGVGEILGRTYFLGCFMSESNGSTIFSEAGIQAQTAHAVATNALDTDGAEASSADVSFTINIPVNMGGEGVAVTILLDDSETASDPAEGANKIAIGTAGITDAAKATALIDAINGKVNALVDFASSGAGMSGILGITAAQGSSDTQITLTMNNPGAGGNVTNAITTDGVGVNIVDVRSFTGGQGGSVPILRGVLLAPSGVALSLSSSYFSAGVSQNPLTTTTATTNGTTPRYGQMTGSIEMAKSGSFVLLLNGFKGSTERESNIITASFDSTSPAYFGKPGVFNRDPLKIEEHGHYLYTDYHIHPKLAIITGSGALVTEPPNGDTHNVYENIAFILTSSVSRGNASLGNVPDYEDWQDRYSHAETPYFISQNLGVNYDLFKLVALSPGEEFSSLYKVSINNIDPTAKTFDMTIRHAADDDANISIAEGPYTNLSLDPDSDFYISRIIGDMNISYDFENSESSQKIIVEGSHPNGKSSLVRVVVSNDLANGNVPEAAIPFGFRGPMHTVTSGSLIGPTLETNFGESDILRRLTEPPIPYRDTLTTGLGTSKQAVPSLYWGYQNQVKIDPAQPNKLPADPLPLAHKAYTQFYPTHRSDTTAFAVKENVGVANVNGSVLDSDLFNKGLFTLENIRVKTGSNGKAIGTVDGWVSASYVRAGGISANASNYTRALNANDLTISQNQNWAKFTCLFQGGFNGVNIFNKDRRDLTNDAVKREFDNATDQGGVKSGPTIKAYRKALDVLGSKSDVDIQLLTNPGIRHSSVTDYGISVAENRFDTLYIMDIEQYDSLGNIMTGSSGTPSISKTVDGFKDRSLDSSFAGAYFPDLNMNIAKSDGSTVTKKVPPTVGVLSAYAKNDTIGKSWFAPAGNSRGKLSNAQSTDLSTLSRENLDTIYEADINPINESINNGVVIQGQKTLLRSLTALDRINVRRLLITVRRAVRNIANTLIFEPNRPETLSKFRSLVNPILESLKSQQGVTRYKVVIDNTTTTQADVENNTIRGKIYIQPVRVAEFIALDFNISNNGIID